MFKWPVNWYFLMCVWHQWFLFTIEQCRFNTVSFLTNIHKRHPIACPQGCGMGCLLWIQHLIDILPQFLWLSMWYLTILDNVIYIYIYIYIYVYTWLYLVSVISLYVSPLLISNHFLYLKYKLDSCLTLAGCGLLQVIGHCSNTTWTAWQFKPPATRLFVLLLVQANMK